MESTLPPTQGLTSADSLKQEHHTWNQTCNSVPGLIVTIDKDFTIRRINRAVHEFFSLSEVQVINRPCHEIFCKQTDPERHCPMPRLLQEERQVYSGVMCFADSDTIFKSTLTPIYDQKQNITGAVLYADEIKGNDPTSKTEHSHLVYLESVLQSSINTAIVATDQDLRIKYFNSEAQRLLGLTKEQTVDLSLKDIHTRLNPGTHHDFQKAMGNIHQTGSHTFAMHRHGYVLDVQISSLRDHDGSFVGLLLMGRDITKQYRAEQEKEKALLRLQRAEKMEAIGMLAGGVAHDLNNILSGVINYPEMLLETLPEDSTCREPVEAILAAGKRAAAVVSDLLTLARGVAMVKHNISINALALDYLHSLEGKKLASLYPEVRIHFNPSSDLWYSSCSPIHITKVIMNLVTNAIEAVNGRGDIHISTHNQVIGRTISRTQPIQRGEFIILKVRDTGPGIPADQYDHIFEPFYTTKTMGRSGSGLSLVVVWNAVHEHGGTITVDSSEQGTTFSVYLPACENAEADAKEPAQPLDGLQGNGTVLLVDDDAMQRDVAGKMLTFFGYKVHSVNSGEAAVEYMQNHTADLVVLDMVLGGINGYETFQEIVKYHPGQQVLLVSGYTENDEVKKMLTAGNCHFLKKPYTLKKLGQALKQQPYNSNTMP